MAPLDELWDLVRSIPRGKVSTYGMIGAAMRNPTSGFQVGRWMAQCPEGEAEVPVGSDAVKGEIVSCPDCGAELEVKETAPLALALAPEAQEDWGE